MAKLVIIHVNGDFGNGFTIYLQIFTEDDRQLIGTARGKLPPAKDLYDNYTLWRSPYSNYISGRNSGRISVYGGTETSIINEIKQASKQLKLSLNDWLKQDSQFIAIREKLFQNLKDESEEIRVIFETENIELQRLPWHLWDDFFKHYHRSEVVLSLPVKKLQIISDTKQVKVLAVFGTRETLSNATRIKTEKDWEMLERLLSKDSNACLIKLEQPSLDYLCEQIDEHKPQILFFAGHSRSEENGVSGYIDLNDEEIITIDDLEPDLRRAVKRGLQLAIFNSCDGLGIARQLANLHVPNIIVMREPVPDEVAQKFLQRFLEAFAAGKSLHLALRRARERINRLENRFPGATWLPVTFQNPAEPPLTWRSLGGVEIRKQSNQTGVAGKESQIENQASIAWLLTTPDLNQIKSQQTIVTSNSSETQIQSTTLGINAKSSKVENFDEQLINCDNCNHLNPPRAILCEMCYIPLTLAKKSKKEAELSPLPLTNELENKESENKESKKEAELSKGVSSNQKQKSYYGSISGHKLRGRYQIVQQLGLGG
ncbi:CHAT domain-containing protein, partial [Fischerella thermalis]|uniref:CHAT domain-containing protein n=1 Tax=Fischerella thermalis TaxID=372787 RepID=UPI001A029CD7